MNTLVPRLLGIISDKLEAHGVGNFSLAFGAFDSDKSGMLCIVPKRRAVTSESLTQRISEGFIDRKELQAFLSKYGIILREQEVMQNSSFLAFLSPVRDVAVEHSLLSCSISSMMAKKTAASPTLNS